MKLTKELEIVDLGLLININTLVIADTHIGYEEALNKQGYFLPRFQFKATIDRLKSLFNLIKIKYKIKKLDKIIINGDIKHEFGFISNQEWRHTLQLIEFLSKYTKELILIKGNHDKILGPIAKKRNIKVVDSIIIKENLILHGDKEPKKEQLKGIKTIIIGHEHPAISLHEGKRTETYKCFLKGKYKRKELIVLPSFNLITEGTNILNERLLSPLLKQKLDNFEVFIVADKVYSFGKVKQLR